MDTILMPAVCRDLIIKHVIGLLPEEACGILAGKKNQITRVFPVENKLHSPSRFIMDAKAQIETFSHLEKQALELIGIYHSHPNGPAFLSERDAREHGYPEAISLICYPDEKNNWQLILFKLHEGKTTPLNLLIY